jgi:hypothetical protein
MSSTIDQLATAIQAALASRSGIAAFALVTDSEYRSVYGAALSDGLFQDEGVEILDIPFDWDIEFHTPEFDCASLSLAELVNGLSSYEERTEWVARQLEAAITLARDRLPALRSATLVLSCAGGGQMWEGCSVAAFKRLNA